LPGDWGKDFDIMEGVKILLKANDLVPKVKKR